MSILVTDGCDISSEITLRLTSHDLSDDESTLVQIMAWCSLATSHYLNQCWPRSLLPYGVTWPQWVNPAYPRVCWRWNIPRALSQYHACWCPGSLRRQTISSLGIDSVSQMGPVFCKKAFKVPIPSVLRDDRKWKYIFLQYHIWFRQYRFGACLVPSKYVSNMTYWHLDHRNKHWCKLTWIEIILHNVYLTVFVLCSLLSWQIKWWDVLKITWP